MTATTTTTEPATVYDALWRFIATRSGIDARNYIRDYRDTDGRAAFRHDHNRIARDGRDARTMLAYAAAVGVTVPEFAAASRCDRLTIEVTAGGFRLDFTAGQYFAIEYRSAACRVIANAIREHWRNSGAEVSSVGVTTRARRLFGRGVSGRWFE